MMSGPHTRAAMKPSSFSRFIERLPPKRSRIALRRSSSASVNGSGFTAHLPPRLLPRIGPPPVAECDSMACGELCCWRQNTASGQEPSNKLITERTLSWPFPSICRPLLRARRKRPRRCCAAAERDELAPPQSIELHSVPRQPGPDCRISDWRGSVRRQRRPEQCPARAVPAGQTIIDQILSAASLLADQQKNLLGTLLQLGCNSNLKAFDPML